LLLTYISNQNEFSEFRNDDCYAFLAKATEGDQPGGWYDLMQRNAEGSLDTDEIETFKEIAIPVDEREINEIPI